MRSVDANILLRLLLEDDEAQLVVARSVLKGPCLILPTVLLEVVWTAQRQSGRTRTDIAAQLAALMELPHLRFVEEQAVAWTIERYAEGADFGDMLHVALSGEADSFATFDVAIAKSAKGGVVPVETLRA